MILKTTGIAVLGLSLAQTAFALSDSVDFAGPWTFDESSTIQSIAAGRFRSGNVDDMVYIDESRAIYYRRSQGNNKEWDSSVTVSSSKTYNRVYSGDVNGDGLDDVIALDNSAGFDVFLANNAGGSQPFASPISHQLTYVGAYAGSSGQSTSLDDMALADFNGDGRPDIVFSGTYVFSSGGDGGSTKPSTTYYSQGAYAVSMNNGSGNFSTPGLDDTWAYEHGTSAASFTAFWYGRVTAGDFNGDGKMDAGFCYHMSASIAAPATKVVPGTGNGIDMTNAKGTTYNECQDMSAFLPNGPWGRVMPSGKARLLVTLNSSSHAMQFASNWTISVDQELDNSPRGPIGPITDFNFDNSADLVFLDGNSSIVVVGWDWTTTADGKIKDPFDVKLGTDIQRGDFGDFDGDGHLDIIGGNTDDDINMYLNNLP